MKRNGRARLSIKQETLKRLAAGDLAVVAGGRVRAFCTYKLSGCISPSVTSDCDSKNCITSPCQ